MFIEAINSSTFFIKKNIKIKYFNTKQPHTPI